MARPFWCRGSFTSTKAAPADSHTARLGELWRANPKSLVNPSAGSATWQGGSLEGSPGLAAQTGCQALLLMTPLLIKMPPSLVLSCPCPCSFQKPGHQLTQGKNPDKTLGYINFFFLRTFLSAPICCWAWGRSIKTDKNESTNLWSSAPELGRFPGAGVSREEGEEAGEGQGEKMNSCRAIKPASLPYCPKQEAI